MFTDNGNLIADATEEFSSLDKARDVAFEVANEYELSVSVCRGLPLSENTVEIIEG